MKWCITNGDLATEVLRRVFPQLNVLAWRDALHEGPVRTGLGFSEFSALRAQFIAAAGWAPAEEVYASFAQREANFFEALGGSEITLCFEHDLYDQLQLAEILYWLDCFRADARVYIVQPSNFLTELSDESLRAHFEQRRLIDAPLLAAGGEAFKLYAGEDPRPLLASAKRGFSGLPFLSRAVLRHCAEFPAPDSGLGLTAERTLAELKRCSCPCGEVFQKVQVLEEARYLGDVVFAWQIDQLAQEPHALIASHVNRSEHYQAFWEQTLELTAFGRDVAAGKANALSAGVGRHLGGTPPEKSRLFLFDRNEQVFLSSEY